MRTLTRAPTVVVAGALAQKPAQGGHSWVPLQYVLGFRQLGWEVLFLDRLEPDGSIDASGCRCPVDSSVNLEYFRTLMARFGLNDASALVCDGGARFIGLSRREVLERTRQSAFLLNIMGFLTDDEILGCAARRVFLDIDPGFGQMWHDLGLADLFRGHDDFVTIGGNVGSPDCAIPTCGLAWIPTAPLVSSSHWQADGSSPRESFTSIASWRGRYGPVEYRGKTYGLRVHEFRKFVELPRLSGRPFEVALRIDPAETKDLRLLADNGWRLADPDVVARDPWEYRRYIQGSKAEFSIAKNIYVDTNSGWLSDRSVCYLASGRPVLTQDTGIGRRYPTGEGLLTFRTLDEAVAGVEELSADYPRHARAARALVDEYFDSDTVLTHLLASLGVA